MPGDEIKAVRKKAGMTQMELAERLGVSKGAVAAALSEAGLNPLLGQRSCRWKR